MVRHHDVVGRYVTIEVDDCEYKVFYLQNGKGIPLICQHTAGCHNHNGEVCLKIMKLLKTTMLLLTIYQDTESQIHHTIKNGGRKNTS